MHAVIERDGCLRALDAAPDRRAAAGALSPCGPASDRHSRVCRRPGQLSQSATDHPWRPARPGRLTGRSARAHYVLVILGLIVLVALWAVWVTNGLIKLRNLVQEAWRQIDVELKRRHDLIRQSRRRP